MSPRNEEQNQRIRDERREQILQAALEVFAQKGWNAAKIGDVAKTAGLSHGLVYHYFKSKDELFTELVREAMAMSTEIFLQGAAMPGTPWEKLTAIAETIIPNAYQGVSPYYFLIMIQAYTSEAIPPEVKSIVDEYAPRYMDELIPIITEGQRTGMVADGDPGKMVIAFLSMIQGLAIYRIQDGDDMLLPEPEMALRIFKPNQPAEKEGTVRKETRDVPFHPAVVDPMMLNYRSIAGEAGFPGREYQTSMESMDLDGQDLVMIRTVGLDGEVIAHVRPDWRPIRIESRDRDGKLIMRITYGDDMVTFEPSGKEPKRFKVRGSFFDSNTLFHFLRGYPFGTGRKISFDLVMDGKGGSPLGSYKMSVEETGREVTDTTAGTFDCYRLEMGVSGIAAVFAAKYRSVFWYTANEPHVLVRYQDTMGRMTELVSPV